MHKYISLEAAISAVKAVPDGNWKPVRYVHELEAIPTADVVERTPARWIEDGYTGEPCVCSNCGEPGKPEWRFCPNCGAECKGGQSDD